MDPYTILKLPNTASDAEIKKAYRLQMLQLHPDKLSPTLSEESIAAITEKFHNVKDAYEFLTNPMHLTSRRMYMAKMASRRAEYERREAFMRRNGMSSGAAAGGVHGYHSGGGGAAGMAGTGMPPPGYGGTTSGRQRTNGNSYAVPKRKHRTRAEPGIPEEEEIRRDARGRRASADENRRYYRGAKDVSDAKRSKSRSDKRQNGYKSERDTAATGRKKSSSYRHQSSSGANRRGREKSSERQREERTRSEPRHRREKYDSTDDERFADPKDHERERRKSTRRGKSTDRRRQKERASAEERRKRARSAPARYHSKNKHKSSSKNKGRDKRGEKEHPREYYCPLTKRLMKDPVIDTEGNTYEREAIERWLRVQSSSPITNGYLSLDMLKPNRDLKKEIYKATGECSRPESPDWTSTDVPSPVPLRENNNNRETEVQIASEGEVALRQPVPPRSSVRQGPHRLVPARDLLQVEALREPRRDGHMRLLVPEDNVRHRGPRDGQRGLHGLLVIRRRVGQVRAGRQDRCLEHVAQEHREVVERVARQGGAEDRLHAQGEREGHVEVQRLPEDSGVLRRDELEAAQSAASRGGEGR